MEEVQGEARCSPQEGTRWLCTGWFRSGRLCSGRLCIGLWMHAAVGAGSVALLVIPIVLAQRADLSSDDFNETSLS
jgi:hypothetical protein